MTNTSDTPKISDEGLAIICDFGSGLARLDFLAPHGEQVLSVVRELQCARRSLASLSARNAVLEKAAHPISDLMVTNDDASTIHWRNTCCDQGGCLVFFQIAKVDDLYPPWNRLRAAVAAEQPELHRCQVCGNYHNRGETECHTDEQGNVK